MVMMECLKSTSDKHRFVTSLLRNPKEESNSQMALARHSFAFVVLAVSATRQTSAHCGPFRRGGPFSIRGPKIPRLTPLRHHRRFSANLKNTFRPFAVGAPVDCRH